ncbi:MAG: 8-amino-7-oxononanoate synthase [Pseudomonadota bacterium]|nr:8-amino-7-oxononanoate synthase [Pseudomonadota bacterium]
MSDLMGQLTSALEARRSRGRLRTLETRSSAQGVDITMDGRRLVNFTSNDYLGLADDPRLIRRVHAELDRHGFGSGAASLLSGRSQLHAELEQRLARFTGMEAALVFSSGYLANLGAIAALVERRSYVMHDRLNHASLIDAVVASGAQHRRYPHLDMDGLDARLSCVPDAMKWIITESVFSMDGDMAPIGTLARLSRKREATLYIDDAHGFGVTHGGRGVFCALADTDSSDYIVMVTFGKALGSMGAAILASQQVIDYLVQTARTFVYDTALPPVCAAAALEALSILEEDDRANRKLAENITHFRAAAAAAGLPIMDSNTPIQPILIGEDVRAVGVAEGVCEDGFYVRAIRPPTVPDGSARIRITLSAAHQRRHLEDLASSMAYRLSI